MKRPKKTHVGTDLANAANAKANAAALELQKNFAQDLSNPNVADIIPGGGAADAMGSVNSPLEMKKRQKAVQQPDSLAQRLGIN